MSYWSYEYEFSQFDKDAINRAHADQLILSATAAISQIQNAFKDKMNFGDAASQTVLAQTLIERSTKDYATMHYADAVQAAALAVQAAGSALAIASSQPDAILSTALIFLLIGIVVGSTLIFIAFRKYNDEVTAKR
jgi:hypothetical protein